MASRQIFRTLRSSRQLLCSCVTSKPLTSVSLPHVIHRSPLITQSVATFHTTGHFRNERIVNIQDEADFNDRVINNAKPVVVDFHAAWCGPCKMLGPRLEAIASKREDFVLAKVDIDENSDLAIEHGVEAVPTVLAVKSGKIVDKFVGLKDDDALDKFVNKLTGK